MPKRLQLLGSFGAPTDAQVAAAVSDYIDEHPMDFGVRFTTNETLTLDPDTGVLSVNTTNVVEKDNTLPVTSAAVEVVVGNIGAILDAI